MQGQIEELRKLTAELHEIKNRPFAAGALDMVIFLNTKLDTMEELLNELAHKATPDYPDQQRILNHEWEASLIYEKNHS